MGRMKSLGYAYAEHLGDGVDVDWYFESIVNGEIEIPKWFVEEWMEANPIFASENETLTGICWWCDKNAQQLREVDYGGGGFICPTCHYSYRKLGYNPHRNPHPFKRKAEIFESRGESGPSWPDDYGYDNPNDYEVIMVSIGHTMERDGRVQVFGDVVFGLPNDRRSRISSFGTGSDKASARQALIDRATGYLIEEEQLHDYMTRNHLEAETFGVEESCMICSNPPVLRTQWGHTVCGNDDCRIKALNMIRKENVICDCGETMKPVGDGYYECNACYDTQYIGDVEFGAETFGAEGVYCEVGRHRVASDQIFGYDEDGDEICTACMNQYFGAETKSWRYQKRDASGRFAKGFQETVELSDFMEMNPDEIPAVSETYTPEQVVAFINDCINNDDFPEQMMDQVFLDSIQKVTAAADEELLEGLNAAANTALIEQLIYDDKDGIMGAKRAIFVTDVFLDFKWGQENWAAEDY